MKTHIRLLTAVLALSACAVEDDAPSVSNTQTAAAIEDGKGFHAVLEQIHGAPMQVRPGSLCHTLKRHTGGAGLYRVVSMESFMEENAELKQLHPQTYVNLERLEAWSVDAPKDPVARINGGVYPNGVTGGFPVSLIVGEKVGLVLSAPTPENLGFYALHSAGVFRDVGGGRYSNERLFTKQGATLVELAKVVSERADLSFEDCRKDDVRTDIEDPEAHVHGHAPSKEAEHAPQDVELTDKLGE